MSRHPERPFAHAKNARKISQKESYVINWIRKIQTDGREPEVMVLEQMSDDVSVSLLGFVEKCYIKSLREIGHRLTNLAEGGQGGKTCDPEVTSVSSRKAWSVPGRREEARLRAAAFHKANPGLLCSNLGWKGGEQHTEETKQKIRDTNRKTWADPERREQAKLKTLSVDAENPDRRIKIKAARAKQVMPPVSDQTRQAQSDAWTDERRALNPLRGRERPQEFCDKLSTVAKKRRRNSRGHFEKE